MRGGYRRTGALEHVIRAPSIAAMTHLLRSFVAVGALFLTACSGGDDAPMSSAVPEMDASDANVLVDTDWHLTSLAVGEDTTAFEGTQVPRIAFEADSLVLDDGVNTARGPYSLEGEDFSVGPLAATKKAYPEPLEPEHAIFGFVETATSAVVRGDTLVLSFPSGELKYDVGEPVAAPIDLRDTAWRLIDVASDNGSANATLAPVPAVVTFGETDIEVYDGVNTAAGTFEVDGSDVSIDLGAPSTIAYPPQTQPQYQLIAQLPSAASGELLANTNLRLVLEDGTALTFEVAAGGLSGG